MANDHAAALPRPIKRYLLGSGVPDLAGSPVLPREMLDSIRSSDDIILRSQQAAGREADAILQAARDEARTLLAKAREDAAAMLEGARQQAAESREQARGEVWREAAQLLEELNSQRTALLTEGGSMLAQLARAGLQQLLLEEPSSRALASSVRLVLQEWRAVQQKGVAILRVPAEELHSLPAELREGRDWHCNEDAALPPGTCVLMMEGTEMRAQYDASVRSLVASLGTATDHFLRNEDE